MKFTIITDTSCDLQLSDLQSDLIKVVCVPINIIVGEKTFNDDEKLDTAILMAEIKASKNACKSSAPSPQSFIDVMRENDNIICTTISAKLSGTYNSARLAAESVLNEFPQKNIFVLDSLSAAAGLGLILLKLKSLIEGGTAGSFLDVVQKVTEFRDQTKIRFVLQDFSTLIKSGRMSKIVGFIAATFIVRPICGDNGAGEIKMFSKTIGNKKALNALSRFVDEKAEQGKDIPVVITHNHNAADAESLKETLTANGYTNVHIFPMRGIASMYAGEKGISIAY